MDMQQTIHGEAVIRGWKWRSNQQGVQYSQYFQKPKYELLFSFFSDILFSGIIRVM